MSLFPSIFCIIAFFSLTSMETDCVVRFSLPSVDPVFLPCDYGLDF